MTLRITSIREIEDRDESPGSFFKRIYSRHMHGLSLLKGLHHRLHHRLSAKHGAVFALSAVIFMISIIGFKYTGALGPVETRDANAAIQAGVSHMPIAKPASIKSPSLPLVAGEQIALKPERLREIKAYQAAGLFGESLFVRADSPTTIWQYRNHACVLDLYFKAQKDGKPSGKVQHYELRSRTKAPLGDKAQCLRSLFMDGQETRIASRN